MTSHQRVDLAGIVVDLMEQDEAVHFITERARAPRTDQTVPLSVVSANLDHIVQFGQTGRWRRTLGDSLRPTLTDVDGSGQRVDWLTLLDGAPLVAQAERLTGRSWPRLAGSDLVGPLLDAAEESGISVGFLGGSYLIQRLLSRQMIHIRPGLVVAGMWSPDREDLADDEASMRLARQVRDADVDVLVVGLGKPRQELWTSRFGPATGAKVLLSFGAVVDFLADAIQRAPRVASDHGLEWAWRLAREPRRLAKRYLLDDPPGLMQLRRDSLIIELSESTVSPPVRTAASRISTFPPEQTAPTAAPGSFIMGEDHADVTVVTVTYNSADHVEHLIASLREEARDLRLRVIAADNDSTDATVQLLTGHDDVQVVPTGGNLGYSAGINAGLRHAGSCDAVLILNPDLTVSPGAIRSLLAEIQRGAADIVVPRLLDENGNTQWSLRREPSISRAWGDALFGAHWLQRPEALAETDTAPESYQFGHELDWATGAAVMIRRTTAQQIGPWDEQFFLYSEETDYFRRARELDARVWFEPNAVMMHSGAGSGSSASLNALMAVNRLRYMRKHHAEPTPSLFRMAVLANEVLRMHRPERHGVLSAVADEARWDALPGPTPATHLATVLTDFPRGSVIIPAHNEAAVIGRTLASIEPVLRTGRVDVFVVCNGCTDDTAQIASAVPGVTVLDCPTPSKTAAMNMGDASATQWPRVYLDADTEISPTTLRLLLQSFDHGTLAARPAFVYDDDGASWPVRAYYRARRRLPSTKQALWGAGVFALSKDGHDRFGAFPNVTADDYFVDQTFTAEERIIVAAPPVPVRTPRNVRSLLAILRRQHRGPVQARTDSASFSTNIHRPAAQELQDSASSSQPIFVELLRSVRGPSSAIDALSYSGFAAAPRLRPPARGTSAPAWERDDSSRTVSPTDHSAVPSVDRQEI